MTDIVWIHAREILDSRGNPTVEAEVGLESGALGRAIVPSGASTGEHEALELRDGDAGRFLGKGVEKAVANVIETIAPELIGADAADQAAIDAALCELDGTATKSALGANAILAVSMACARAAAVAHELPLYRYLGGVGALTLPVPMMNIINGGAHADNALDIQEFMICRRLRRFEDALGRGRVFHTSRPPQKQGLDRVGDEAVRPELTQHRARLLLKAIAKAATSRHDVAIGSTRPTELFRRAGTSRRVRRQTSGRRDRSTRLDRRTRSFYRGRPLQDEGRLVMGPRATRGDDLFVTNVERLGRGISEGIANSILVKVNQIGSLTETLEAVRMAHRGGYTSVMSHRSGETEDTTIADLAVACDCGQIKTGSASRTDRIAKYNQLLRIEEELGKSARYAGRDAFKALR
jgi:enolase